MHSDDASNTPSNSLPLSDTMQLAQLPAGPVVGPCNVRQQPLHSRPAQLERQTGACKPCRRRICSAPRLAIVTASAAAADRFASRHESTCRGHSEQSQPSAAQHQPLQQPESSQQQLTAPQPQQQHPAALPWLPPQVRTAAYLLLGGLLAWRCWAAQLGTSSGAFASLSFSSGFNSASQTGLTGAARSAIAGFIAGLLHTLAGADHLAALTPLTIGRSQGAAALLGSLWGFGHSTGQLILGLLMVVLKDRFDAFVPALSRWGGTTVGLSLVAIGAFGLLDLWKDHREAQAARAQQPAFEGADGASSVSSVAASTEEQEKVETDRLGMGLFANGILFGLQPDALFVIIPALTLPTRLAAVAYMSMFVLGTVAAMGGYTAIIGATSKVIQERSPWLTTNLSVLASCVAIAIGGVVLLGTA